jgi:hypothetical protein
LTIDPIPPGALTVTPVVEYEPPARAVPQCGPPTLRRPSWGRVPHSVSDHSPIAVPSPALRTAARFADAALRRVLEVVDKRRPAAHLRPLLAVGLVDSVLSVHPAAAGRTERTDAATLRRVRLQVVGDDDPPAAVEVFGTYRRGPRIHALACRVERARAGAGPDWQIVALHIG